MYYLILFYSDTVRLTQKEMGPQYTISNANQLQPMLPKFKLSVRFCHWRQNAECLGALDISTQGKAWWKTGDSNLWPLAGFQQPTDLENVHA